MTDPTHLNDMIAAWRKVETPSVVLATADLHALLDLLETDPEAEDDGPCSCGGRRWVDDENWSPEYPELWRGERSPGDGLIPCGFCNFGGWYEPVCDGEGCDLAPAPYLSGGRHLCEFCLADAPTELAPSTPRGNETAGSVGKSTEEEEVADV